MSDRAFSDHPAVRRQLDRIGRRDEPVFGLERIRALLPRLGNPERRLPPVFHVAGTNGKGSTCAFLRAAIEAAGLRAHVYTSPPLVRINEQIRVGGKLIEDEALAGLLEEVLDAGEDIGPSLFETTTAAAFLLFSRVPADACIVEVGLGGLTDATNVVPRPAMCGIAQLGVDHGRILGNDPEAIAAAKAGIAKPGVPLVTQLYPPAIAKAVGATAEAAGADWLPRGGRWDAKAGEDGIRYRDEQGELALPLPVLAGAHQAMNGALAVAMIRHQSALRVPEDALRAAMVRADWPGRLQLIGPGPLRDMLPEGSELWVDGGHNPAAAGAIADHFSADEPLDIVFGLLSTKDLKGMLEPFEGRPVAVHTVPVPGHIHHEPETLAAAARAIRLKGGTASDVHDALRRIAERGEAATVLVFGSLHLAGDLLRRNGQPPD
jgi:dihydrofolate synthase/folylpolyglutamate synthase